MCFRNFLRPTDLHDSYLRLFIISQLTTDHRQAGHQSLADYQPQNIVTFIATTFYLRSGGKYFGKYFGSTILLYVYQLNGQDHEGSIII